jgi:NAD-dependent deacetylase
MPPSKLETAAALLRAARRVVVFTGAGMSADSGMATFRTGKGKLWGGRRLERFGNLPGYLANADEAWAWYAMRERAAREAEPHAGYHAINMIATSSRSVTVVTQNIDGLHHRTGNPNVHELHGNLREVKCAACGTVTDWPRGEHDRVPRCVCGGVLRPNVVLFGEDLPMDVWRDAIRAAEQADLLISVGTSHLVQPAASIPEHAWRRGAKLVAVNTRETDAVPGALFLRGRAARMLAALVDAI